VGFRKKKASTPLIWFRQIPIALNGLAVTFNERALPRDGALDTATALAQQTYGIDA
jgi:hypothetical protein